MRCYFCDSTNRKEWSGYFCTTCEEIQSLSKVYGFERMLDIIQTVCLRNQEQLENKIKNLNKKKSNVITRSKSENVMTI